MLFSLLLLGSLILVPLLAHWRGWRPAALFLSVALIYAVCGAVSLARLLWLAGPARQVKLAFGVDYDVIPNAGHTLRSRA